MSAREPLASRRAAENGRPAGVSKLILNNLDKGPRRKVSLPGPRPEPVPLPLLLPFPPSSPPIPTPEAVMRVCLYAPRAKKCRVCARAGAA